MKTFFISDNHFYHSNILNFIDEKTGRNIRSDFSSMEEMNEYMIERWNSVVSPNDKVYHLGDIVMKTGVWAFEILNRLNGQKILIRGNHDKAKLSVYASHFKDVRSEIHMKTSKRDMVVFTHRPIRFTEFDKGFNVHGHIHQNVIDDYRYFNASVELLNYTPIEWSELSSILEKRNETQQTQVWSI